MNRERRPSGCVRPAHNTRVSDKGYKERPHRFLFFLQPPQIGTALNSNYSKGYRVVWKESSRLVVLPKATFPVTPHLLHHRVCSTELLRRSFYSLRTHRKFVANVARELSVFHVTFVTFAIFSLRCCNPDADLMAKPSPLALCCRLIAVVNSIG